MSENILHLEGIQKSFQDTPVLRGISLCINAGEFLTLLGPSGCGKTTTLRIIAGLEKPDAGRVVLEGNDVTDVEPNKRNVNTVFQNYALFPHMSVEANIGYSLRLRRMPKAEIKREVAQVLDLVQLSGFGKRMPNELSGGQRQRVAIARAVVSKPKILLLDEPLGALDLQLRRQMQIELKKLQQQLGITFVYITHDQEEALNMSDRIAVMRDGMFEQVGSPADVYDRPKTSYVASFVGNANIISGTVTAVQPTHVLIKHPAGLVQVERRGATLKVGDTATAAVRSEQVLMEAPSPDEGEAWGLRAVVREKTFAGGMLRIALELCDGSEVIASRHGINSHLQVGDKVTVRWEPAHSVLIDLEADK